MYVMFMNQDLLNLLNEIKLLTSYLWKEWQKKANRY